MNKSLEDNFSTIPALEAKQAELIPAATRRFAEIKSTIEALNDEHRKLDANVYMAGADLVSARNAENKLRDLRKSNPDLLA